MAEHWMGLGDTYRIRMLDDTEYEVTTTLPDIVRVERILKRSWIGGIPSVGDMLSLFWVALRRTGQIDARDREGWGMKVADWAAVSADEFDAFNDDEADDDGDDVVGPTGSGP